MRTLLNPLGVTRFVALAPLRGARLTGEIVRATSQLAADLAGEALEALGLRASGETFVTRGSAAARSGRAGPVESPPMRAASGESPFAGEDARGPTLAREAGLDAPLAWGRPTQPPAAPAPAPRTPRAGPSTRPPDAPARASQGPRAGHAKSIQTSAGGGGGGHASRARSAPPIKPAPTPVAPARPRQSPEQSSLHVSERPTPVGSSADRGAADGAGAELRIEQPWRGYSKMRAADIAERVVAESEAVVSLVLMYERQHRRRSSVLKAAERELGRRSSRGVRAARA